MNRKIVISLIAAVSVLICISPVVAAENNALFEYALFDLNIFGDSPDNITVENLKIEKLKKEHTDSNGKTDKKTSYSLKFKVKSNEDSFGNYSVKVVSYDKNGKEIKTVKSYVDKEGDVKIPLKTSKSVKKAKLTITDSNNNVLFEKTTKKIKTTEKITKDKPVEKKTTTSTSSSSSSSSASSSSSGQTYWASSNSNKFHYPGCEWAQKISSRNKIVFHSRDEALNSGYVPCQVCGP